MISLGCPKALVDSEEIATSLLALGYEAQAVISRRRLRIYVGRKLRVLIESVEGEVAVGRSMFDAAEIDGAVYVRGSGCRVGEFAWVEIETSDANDLYGRVLVQEIGL